MAKPATRREALGSPPSSSSPSPLGALPLLAALALAALGAAAPRAAAFAAASAAAAAGVVREAGAAGAERGGGLGSAASPASPALLGILPRPSASGAAAGAAARSAPAGPLPSSASAAAAEGPRLLQASSAPSATACGAAAGLLALLMAAGRGRHERRRATLLGGSSRRRLGLGGPRSAWRGRAAGAAVVSRGRGAGVVRHAQARKLLYSDEGRKAVLRGIDKLADAVAVTLGPRGRNVLLDKGEFMAPQIVNDGVTIAKEIELEDEVENTGAQLIKQAAAKTNDVAGDGTTTATILARAMVRAGQKHLAGGANPVQVKAGMDKAAGFVIERIGAVSTAVGEKDLDQIRQVASISAGGDLEAGQMIADAMAKVGGDGVISLEESQSTETEVELTEGMTFEKGYLSPYLCIDAQNPELRQWEASNAMVFITDQKIAHAQKELIPLLTIAKQAARPLLLVADTIEKEVLATLVVNKLRGIIDCCAIQAPGFGENRKAMLQDMALVTGATFIASDLDRSVDNSMTLEDFGTARRVTVKKDATTVVADAPKELLEQRCSALHRLIEAEKSEYSKEQLRKRLAKLKGGVALIKVGATTETELKDKKLRLEDAIAATKAAIDEGIVPGGGTALCHLSQELREWAAQSSLAEDERRGALVVAEAMAAPLRMIAENAGKNGELIVEKVLEEGNFARGYDALRQRFADMIASGIIDPAKVTRSAMLNATSVASMILTTECVVVKAPEKEGGSGDGLGESEGF